MTLKKASHTKGFSVCKKIPVKSACKWGAVGRHIICRSLKIIKLELTVTRSKHCERNPLPP
jgi:hypothetical protein